MDLPQPTHNSTTLLQVSSKRGKGRLLQLIVFIFQSLINNGLGLNNSGTSVFAEVEIYVKGGPH